MTDPRPRATDLQPSSFTDETLEPYRLFHDLPFIGMALTSPNTKRWLQVNQTLCDLLGYPREVLVEMSWAELTHPDDLARDVREFERVMRGETDGYKLDKRFIRADGTTIHASIDVKAIRTAAGDVRYFVATVADISARIEAESDARRSAALLEKLGQQVPGVIYQYLLRPDGTSCFPFASDAIREIYEVEPAAVRDDATAVFSRLHPDDLPRVAASIAESAQALTPWQCEYRVVLPARGERWLRGEARPERFADGSTLWHGFITDCTAQQHQLAALRVRDAAINTAMTAMVIADPTGRPTYVNPAFVRMWGYDTADEVLGGDVSRFLPSGANVGPAVIAALTATGAWQGEVEAQRKDGTTFDALVAANIMHDASGAPAHLMASALDVTDAKKLQSQFLQAQKMESVGRLAGGIAHDFNNLLTVMNGCLELVLDAVPEPGALRDGLLEISRAANSAAALTQQLLAFSRKQIISPQILDLGTVVQKMRGMLQRLLGEDIALEVVTTQAGHIRFDPGQAEQILVNLAVNARDAMPGGGLLTLETSSVMLDERYVREHPGTSSGEYVLLAVSDTGSGMTPETLAHAFEPFFTTKDIGHGTGLGLAMIHGAVSQNGGRVEVYSEPGIGTSFKIYLPRVSEPVSVPVMSARPALPRGTETIVVVEDDTSVRELIVRLLERQGYRVFAFGSGPDALAWVRGHADTVHLLITDVIMPGMNGRELAETVKSLRPAIRVLYASGYTANVIVHHGVLKPGVEFIAKPFAASALATRVRELLDAS